MKNYSRFLLATLLIGGSLTACNNDDDGGRSKNKALKFTTQISSRVTGDNWDVADAIGVYMIKSGQALDDANVLEANKKHTTTGSGTFVPANTAADGIQIPAGETVDFVAYYKYTDVTNYEFDVDVTDQTKPQDIDILYAKTTGITDAAESVTLNFDHKMAKLTFTVTDESGTPLTGLKTTIEGLETKATFDIATGDFDNDATSVADIVAVTNVASATSATSTAIILPTTGTTGMKVIFSNSSFSLTHEFTDGTPFAGGDNYTYNVKITAEGTLAVSGSINPWTSIPGSDIELDINDGMTPPPTPGGDAYPAGTLASWDFSELTPATGQEGAWAQGSDIFPIPQTGAADMASGSTLTVAGEEWTSTSPSINVWTSSSKTISLTGWSTSKYWLVAIPLDKEIEAGQIEIDWRSYGSNTGPANFILSVSTDNSTWTQVQAYSIVNSTQATDIEFSTTYTVPSTIDASNLYFKWQPADNVSINGGTFVETGASRIGEVSVAIQ